jgi:hypothetical protein
MATDERTQQVALVGGKGAAAVQHFDKRLAVLALHGLTRRLNQVVAIYKVQLQSENAREQIVIGKGGRQLKELLDKRAFRRQSFSLGARWPNRKELASAAVVIGPLECGNLAQDLSCQRPTNIRSGGSFVGYTRSRIGGLRPRLPAR